MMIVLMILKREEEEEEEEEDHYSSEGELHCNHYHHQIDGSYIHRSSPSYTVF